MCEKIPTLGTQLRVLSTVKATMMGQNMDSEEDQVALYFFLNAGLKNPILPGGNGHACLQRSEAEQCCEGDGEGGRGSVDQSQVGSYFFLLLFLFASLSFCFSLFLLLFLFASLHNVSSSLRSDAGFKLKWVRKQPWFHQ